MTRAAGRTIAAALLGALGGALWLAIFYNLHGGLRIDFHADPPSMLSGVYPAERTPDQSLTFAWTGKRVTLRVPAIDRGAPWRLSLRVRGARLAETDNPVLTIAADGLTLVTTQTTTDFSVIETDIPVNAERRGLTLTADVSTTFRPGDDDPRALGVMLDWIRLEPSATVVPPRPAVAGAALAAAAFGAAVSLLGVTAGSAMGATLLAAAAIASVIARGSGPYTTLPSTAASLSVALSLALVLLTAAARTIGGQPLRNTAKFVAAFAAGTALLKLMVLLHPDTPVGDALFQAHRFQEVVGGRWLFTSVAPGGYQFPYAPGLYVFALPFAGLVTRGVADMTLLRIIVVLTDTLVAFALYWLVVRARGDRLAAALAAALYLLMPLDFGVVRTGNLTNAFAQSLSVLAFVLMAGVDLGRSGPAMRALLLVALLVAFLSHTSAFAILAAAAFLIGHAFFWHGGGPLRRSGLVIAACAAIAVVLAIGLYYGHFLSTYRSELARIGTETATAAPDAGGRGILARLTAVPRYLRLYYGVPVLALMAYGVATFVERRVADRFSLALAGWSAACLAFLALGIVTPVDMRYYLAAIPAVALFAASGASRGWLAGGAARVATASLLGWAGVQGAWTWWSTIG